MTNKRIPISYIVKALDKRGYKWSSGTKLTTETHYEDEEDTCYNLKPNNRICCNSFAWYQRLGYTIIEFTDIDFKEEL